MRIRTVKPEFWTSFSIAKLSEPAALLAIGLMNHACDKGYFEADPRMIKASVLPLRDLSRSIPGVLQELSGIGFIEVRIAHDGRLIGRVVNFARHQLINKPAKRDSKACVDFATASPASEFCNGLADKQLTLTEDSGSATTPLREDSGKSTAGTGNREQGTDIAPRPSPERARGVLFDSLAIAEGSDPKQLTKPAAKRIGVALSQIKAVAPDVAPSDIQARAKAYKRLYPNAACTANALAVHWAKLGGSWASQQASESDAEPDDWRAWWRNRFPPEDCPDAPRYEDGTWGDVRADHRRMIIDGLRRMSV